MREAVGGSMLFYIIIGFLFIYIVFIGVIMNYAATYRASNYVLTTLEETEGKAKLGTKNDTSESGSLYGNLRARHYYNDLVVCCSDNSHGAVFKITTTVTFTLPLLDIDLDLNINNETKTIYGVKCSSTDYKGC